jgi:hypothetical protein
MERSQSHLVLLVGSLEPEKILDPTNPASWVFFLIEQREIKLDMAIPKSTRPFSYLEKSSLSPRRGLLCLFSPASRRSRAAIISKASVIRAISYWFSAVKVFTNCSNLPRHPSMACCWFLCVKERVADLASTEKSW